MHLENDRGRHGEKKNAPTKFTQISFRKQGMVGEVGGRKIREIMEKGEENETDFASIFFIEGSLEEK